MNQTTIEKYCISDVVGLMYHYLCLKYIQKNSQDTTNARMCGAG